MEFPKSKFFFWDHQQVLSFCKRRHYHLPDILVKLDQQRSSQNAWILDWPVSCMTWSKSLIHWWGSHWLPKSVLIPGPLFWQLGSDLLPLPASSAARGGHVTQLWPMKRKPKSNEKRVVPRKSSWLMDRKFKGDWGQAFSPVFLLWVDLIWGAAETR